MTDPHSPQDLPTSDTHVCEVTHLCKCESDGLEPNILCPVHGHGDWPIRCGTCGRFMPITYASRTDPW